MSLATFMQSLMTPEQVGGVPVNAPGISGPVGAEDYRQLIAREMARYPNDRDQAVRSANIAGGYGNSTAQRFLHDPAAAAAAAPMPVPTPRPDMQQTAAIPVPRPTGFPPDLAVSPTHPADPMAAGAPTNNPPMFTPPANPQMAQGSVLQTPPPDLQPPRLPPDLAVSPNRPDNRPSPKTKARKKAKPRSQYALEPDPARFGR